MACVPVGKVWAKVYSFSFLATSVASDGPSVTPLSFNWLERVMPWPLLFSVISEAMSFFGPPMPSCTP